MNTIAIGIDGSETANEALRVAADEARLHDARLRIVVVWQLSSLMYGSGYAAFDEDTLDAVRARAQGIADKAVAMVAELAPTVECEAVVLEGQPADALLGASKDADLIVVGSRHKRFFERLVEGSVNQNVLRRAGCDVLVVY